MQFLSLGWLVALVLIVHCYKTGRDKWWMWALLIMGPLASIAYLILEVVPEMFGSYSGRRAARKLKQVINPQGAVNKLSDDLERNDSIETRRRLAEELLDREDYAAAEKLYRESRAGMFEFDPVIMLGHAYALFGLERFDEAVEIMDRLMSENPQFKSQNGHLLYARALAGAGQHEKAVSEFDAVVEYFAGPEAHIQYARYLETQDNSDHARKLYQKVLDVARLSPAHYRRTHKQWIKIARQNL